MLRKSLSIRVKHECFFLRNERKLSKWGIIYFSYQIWHLRRFLARAGKEQSTIIILMLQNFTGTFCWLFSPSCYYLLTYNEPLFSAALSIFYRGHIGPGSGAAKNCSTPKLFMIITFALRARSWTNQRQGADGSANEKARGWLIIPP